MKKIFILLFVVIFIIGGLLGVLIKDKLLSKNEIKELKQNKIHDSKKSKISFLVREANLQADNIKEFEPSMEKVLSGKNYDFNFHLLKNNIPKRKMKKDLTDNPVQMGSIDVTKIFRIDSKTDEMDPVFSASPDFDFSCQSEVQFIVAPNSTISTIENLNNKSLGVLNLAFPVAKIRIKELVRENIKFKKLKVYKKYETAISDLISGKLDVFIFRVKKFEDGRIDSKMGKIVDNKYTEHKDVKIIETTNFALPCKVVFINNEVDQNIKNEIKEKFIEVFRNKENKKLGLSSMGIGSIKEITPAQVKEWKELILKNRDIKKKDISSNIDKDLGNEEID